MDLKRLSVRLKDKLEQHLLDLLQNAKLLEKLHLQVRSDQPLEGLHDILSASARTLTGFGLKVLIYVLNEDETYGDEFAQPFEALWEGLEALAGHAMLEVLMFEIQIVSDYHETEVAIGFFIENVEKVLAKPGWSALRQVKFNVPVAPCLVKEKAEFLSLQYLFGGYLSYPSKLEYVAFTFSGYNVKCCNAQYHLH